MTSPSEMPGDLPGTNWAKGIRPSPAIEFPAIAATALAILLIFNSAGLREWTEHLPPGPISTLLVDAAAKWDGLMLDIGTASDSPGAPHLP